MKFFLRIAFDESSNIFLMFRGCRERKVAVMAVSITFPFRLSLNLVSSSSISFESASSCLRIGNIFSAFRNLRLMALSSSSFSSLIFSYSAITEFLQSIALLVYSTCLVKSWCLLEEVSRLLCACACFYCSILNSWFVSQQSIMLLTHSIRVFDRSFVFVLISYSRFGSSLLTFA